VDKKWEKCGEKSPQALMEWKKNRTFVFWNSEGILHWDL